MRLIPLTLVIAILTGIAARAQDIEKMAPPGFDSVQTDIPHGMIDTVEMVQQYDWDF